MRKKAATIAITGACCLTLNVAQAGQLAIPGIGTNGGDFIWSSSGGVQVYDANGKNLGVLLDLNSATILNKQSGYIFSIGKVSSAYYIQPWDTGAYVYSSDNCTGAPMRVIRGDLTQDRPKDLSGGVGLVRHDVYSEFYIDASWSREFTGRTIGLGKMLSEERNQGDDQKIASSNQIHSVAGTWTVRPHQHGNYCGDSGPNYSPVGCTTLNGGENPSLPPQLPQQNPDGTYTYKGVIYPNWAATEDPYCSDSNQYSFEETLANIYIANNGIPSHATRWVYDYAEIKLPLKQPFAVPFTFK